MPRHRRAPMSCARWRRSGRCTWIRTVPSRARRRRCASEESPSAVPRRAQFRCEGLCCRRSQGSCSGSSTVCSIRKSMAPSHRPGRSSRTPMTVMTTATRRFRARRRCAPVRSCSTTRLRRCCLSARHPALFRPWVVPRPTLVVSVRQSDLVAGQGHAHTSGCDEPVSLASARHIACTGAVERVLVGESGRIVSIETLDRIFNHHQRRAIALRDGGCVIPGCHVRAEWCEIHHVDEHVRGGRTHTDNGVMLCWHHHRTLDDSGWKSPGECRCAGGAWAALVGLADALASGDEVAHEDARAIGTAAVIRGWGSAAPLIDAPSLNTFCRPKFERALPPGKSPSPCVGDGHRHAGSRAFVLTRCRSQARPRGLRGRRPRRRKPLSCPSEG